MPKYNIKYATDKICAFHTRIMHSVVNVSFAMYLAPFQITC